MKHAIFLALLCAATFISACAGPADKVTQTKSSPLGQFERPTDLGAATSTRSSIDLLSLY